jgi:hypothetical protein
MTTSEAQARAREQERTPELDDAFDLELEQMALATTEPPIDEPREPGLARYLKFQIRDFVRHRATIMLPLALLVLWIFHHNFEPMLAQRALRYGRSIDAATAARWFHDMALGGGLLLGGAGSIVSVGGIVSRDREGGYQKFLFAKPVRMTRYYLQAFAVNGVGLLALGLVTLLLTSAAFLRPVPIAEVMTGAALTYVAVGGLTFLLSTLVRFDAAAAAVLAVLSFPLAAAANEGRWWAVLTHWLLPPLDRLQALDTTASHRPPLLQAAVSLVLYGATYVAAGLAVLRKRSIIR